MDLSIFITTNGPGELATWVKPVVDALRTHIPEARVLIALLPCPHSSGFEEKVASQIYGSTVMKPEETLRFIMSGKLPPHIIPSHEGMILHLGGDQLFSVGLGWRTKFPVMVYTEGKVLWPYWVEQYLLRDMDNYLKQRRRGIPDRKLSVIGDLMADAVQPTLTPIEARHKLGLKSDAPVVSLLPGSKPLKVLNTTAFMLKVADEVSNIVPDTQFILPQSPFTPLAQLRQAIQNDKYLKVLDGSYGKIMHDNHGTFIVTNKGTMVHIVPSSWHYNALQISDISVTLPGTNTAELAYLGIPMIVVLPLNRPELVPLDGLLGAICNLPILNKILKGSVIRLLLKKLKFVSLPNQKAKRKLVPEFVGQISAQPIAQATGNLLRDNYQRRQISLALRHYIQPEDATNHLIYHTLHTLEKHYPHIREHLAEHPASYIRSSRLASNEEQETF